MLCNIIRTLKTPLYVSDTLALFFYFVHFSTPTFSRNTNMTYFLENIETKYVDIIDFLKQ